MTCVLTYQLCYDLVLKFDIFSAQNNILNESCVSQLPYNFATDIVQAGQILLFTCIIGMTIVLFKRLDVFMTLFNQLIKFDLIIHKISEPDFLKKQKRKILCCQYINMLSLSSAISVPIFICFAILHPMEPIHQLLEKWLEIKISISSIAVYILSIPGLVMFHVGCNAINLLCLILTMYYLVTSIFLEALQADKFIFRTRLSCSVQTKGFSNLDDEKVITLYRTQQVLNVLVNSVFQSVLLSFHQVGCVATTIVMAVILIRYNEVLNREGVIAYVVVCSSMITPLIALFVQSSQLGEITSTSETFRKSLLDTVPRRLMLRKFGKSCRTFYAQVAYPFYNVYKATFVMYIDQSLEYIVQLTVYGI